MAGVHEVAGATMASVQLEECYKLPAMGEYYCIF